MDDRAHIVGAGPVGLALALRLAQSQDVVLYARRGCVGSVGSEPSEASARSAGPRHSVEAIPAGLLAMFVEIGVAPAELGVESLHQHKLVAWEDSLSVCVEGNPVANVERPRLEAALMRRAIATRRIDIRDANRATLKALQGKGAVQVYDASGRRALTATNRHLVIGGPIARTWTREVVLPPRSRGFRMASLTDGYVYALASPTRALIGWCGNRRLLSLHPSDWGGYLRASDVNMFDCLELKNTTLGNWVQGRTGTAGVQRASAQAGCTLVGDAAFSRDALCSQGLAIGLSDAAYAAAIMTDEDRLLWQAHRNAQYVSHLTFLIETIGRCRFKDSEFWSTYACSLGAEKSMFEACFPSQAARLATGRIQATKSFIAVEQEQAL